MSSTLPVSDSPYEVMGVQKDVSDGDLKRRYFQLLRQYPPESHPEEFNRVQHAYELLKDPAARAQLDRKEPYEDVPEPYRTRLREAVEQLRTGRVDLARTALNAMVEENGDLDDARSLLHQVLFGDAKFAESEAQVAVLVKKHPVNTWFLRRHALVLSRLGRHDDALSACERWLELSQGKDPLAWELIAEALAAAKRSEEAYRRLEEGLAKVSLKAPLILTRMHLRLGRDDRPGLEADLRALLEGLPQSEEENRQGAAQRLHSLAAMFFNANHPDEANLLLKAARELGGKAQGLQFPPRLELFIEELPEKSQAWLADEAKATHIFRVLRRGKFWDVAGVLFFTALWGLVALLGVVTESGWPGVLAVPYGALALCATGPMIWAWREASWSHSVPHRRMWSIHPLYMLEIGVEKLVAYPLVNFNEPRIVHQHTNGVYTASTVTLQFGKKKVSLAIHGQQLAVTFAQSLHKHRYRALQLLHGDLLEAEEGYDFIPRDFLEPGFRSKVKGEKRKAHARRWAGSAAVATVLAVVAGVVGSGREREKAWAKAVNTQSPAEMAKALEQLPNGASAEQLGAFRKAKAGTAQQALESTLDKADPRRVTLGVVLGAVQKAARPMLHLRTRPLPVEGTTGAGASAFSDYELAAALGRFPQRLYEGFEQGLTTDARDVLAVAPGSAAQGVTLEVSIKPKLLTQSVQVGNTRWPLLGITVTATLDGQVLVTAEARLDDGDAAMLSSPDTATAVLDAQVQRLLFKAGAELAKALGLGVET